MVGGGGGGERGNLDRTAGPPHGNPGVQERRSVQDTARACSREPQQKPSSVAASWIFEWGAVRGLFFRWCCRPISPPSPWLFGRYSVVQTEKGAQQKKPEPATQHLSPELFSKPLCYSQPRSPGIAQASQSVSAETSGAQKRPELLEP